MLRLALSLCLSDISLWAQYVSQPKAAATLGPRRRHARRAGHVPLDWVIISLAQHPQFQSASVLHASGIPGRVGREAHGPRTVCYFCVANPPAKPFSQAVIAR